MSGVARAGVRCGWLWDWKIYDCVCEGGRDVVWLDGPGEVGVVVGWLEVRVLGSYVGVMVCWVGGIGGSSW